MKDWKTTLTGAISAIAAFVLFAQAQHYVVFPPVAVALAGFAMSGGLAAFGVVSKDAEK